jgi:hypothetical protein
MDRTRGERGVNGNDTRTRVRGRELGGSRTIVWRVKPKAERGGVASETEMALDNESPPQKSGSEGPLGGRRIATKHRDCSPGRTYP